MVDGGADFGGLAQVAGDCFEVKTTGVRFGELRGDVVELGGVVVEDADAVAGGEEEATEATAYAAGAACY